MRENIVVSAAVVMGLGSHLGKRKSPCRFALVTWEGVDNNV